jgi:tRNA dimethylallyltransferase
LTNKPTLIVVGGPTASGKTPAAIDLALKLNTEIINVDSRQVYKELHIGVAKPSAEELLKVTHHGVSTVGIHEHYNAGMHAENFESTIQNLLSSNGSAILCGGTGLYIEALINGLDDMPEIDPDLRSEILDEFVAHGLDRLVQVLYQLDPNAGTLVALDNPQRVMRAIELCIQTQKSLSEIYSQKPNPRFPEAHVIYLGIQYEREKLYQRINQRVDKMIADGLIAEVESLLPHQSLKSLQTVGYSELFRHFAGEVGKTEAIDSIKQHTRNYAKRQITYFTNRFPTRWVAAAEWPKYLRNFEL